MRIVRMLVAVSILFLCSGCVADLALLAGSAATGDFGTGAAIVASDRLFEYIHYNRYSPELANKVTNPNPEDLNAGP